jgi:hypothetical protein
MFLELCFVASSCAPQDANPPANAPPTRDGPKVSVEDEVLANLKGFQIGPIQVAELALPEELLRRVSDRIIRSSFENRFRIVVPDPKPGEGGQQAVLGAPPAPAGAASGGLRLALLVSGAIVGAIFVMLAILFRRRRRGAA